MYRRRNMRIDQMADNIWSWRLPTEKIKPYVQTRRNDVLFSKEQNKLIRQVITVVLVAGVETVKEKMFWTSGKRHKFRHKHKKKTKAVSPAEVTNRRWETFLLCFASDKPMTWARSWAELCYNMSFHPAIQMTPFKAVYGRDPPPLLKYENGSTSNAELEEKLIERDAMISVLRGHIHKAQQMMKQRVDSHRREVELAVGKWSLMNPHIHHTVHVSQLKAALGSKLSPVSLPPQLPAEGVLEAEPEEVWGTRVNAISGQGEVLIKWRGLPAHDCSWE